MTFAGATTLSLSEPNSVVFLSELHGGNNCCTVDKGRKTPSVAHDSSAWWGEVACTSTTASSFG